eukprot:15345605-Ditylum_brightwellii.AAC.1
MEKTCDGEMMYPCITHISHEVGFQFLELTLPLLQQVFDVAGAVTPGGRSNNCTAEHLKTIPEENARKLINTEFSSYLHTDKRDIGHGSTLLRARTTINVGIKVIDSTLNNKDLLQIGLGLAKCEEIYVAASYRIEKNS